MFTVAVLAKEKNQHLADSFGFVKCLCGDSFSFNFAERENCRKDKDRKVMYLCCPSCHYESNEVLVRRYTDADGVQHGSMKYQLIYTK